MKTQDVEKCSFLLFFEKRPLRENFQKSVPTGFIATPSDVFIQI